MLRKHSLLLIFLCLLLAAHFQGHTQKKGTPEKERSNVTGSFHHTTPQHLYNIILSRPMHTAVTISIMANEFLSGYVLYGKAGSILQQRTASFSFEKEKPQHIPLTQLEADTRYAYQFVYTTSVTTPVTTSATGFFHTQRSKGKRFVFTIQADSHLDENCSPEMYQQTLRNMASDSADFMIDLGDTWMTDKHKTDYKASLEQYIAQRYYLGLLCATSPLYLTLGNHDGEPGKGRQGEEEMKNWSTATRKTYYANPEAGDFYSGSKEGNYYAWEWGDALFLVLDPFRYTMDQRQPWSRTLGREQYEWLHNTLAASKCRYRFVFIHNLVGGADNKGIGRGGAEAAMFYEWGGANADSTPGFAVHRNGWQKPIHDLLLQYRVNIVFHGHDHLYARQQKDDIVYQALPQPGAMRYNNINSAKEYGYTSGTILNAPGYIRITVENNTVTVEYIQTSIDAGHQNKQVLHTYTIH